jgi:hypothetical protein
MYCFGWRRRSSTSGGLVEVGRGLRDALVEYAVRARLAGALALFDAPGRLSAAGRVRGRSY